MTVVNKTPLNIQYKNFNYAVCPLAFKFGYAWRHWTAVKWNGQGLALLPTILLKPISQIQKSPASTFQALFDFPNELRAEKHYWFGQNCYKLVITLFL